MKETFGKIFTKGERKEGASGIKLVKNCFSGEEYIPYHEQVKKPEGDK